MTGGAVIVIPGVSVAVTRYWRRFGTHWNAPRCLDLADRAERGSSTEVEYFELFSALHQAHLERHLSRIDPDATYRMTDDRLAVIDT